METQPLMERSNLSSLKYSESNKRTLTIYFIKLLFHLCPGVWGLASRFDWPSVKRPKGSEGTVATPVPAHVEGIDAPYASAARIALLFSTHNSDSSKGNSSIGPPIHPREIHPSIPPFIQREGSFTKRGWGFVRGCPREDAQRLLCTSACTRCRLILFRVPPVCV